MSPNIPPIILVNPATPETLAARKSIQAKQEAYTDAAPKWHQVPGGAAGYREMRREGKSGFPKLVLDPDATDSQVTMRDGTSIVLRMFVPKGVGYKGTLLYIHGGGWVINSAYTQDSYLARLATTLRLTVLCIDYRLAPEHPFPTPNNDCIDALLHILSNDTYDTSKLFIAGDSAGAQLAVTAVVDLRDNHQIDVQGRITALALSFGQYDLSGTPSLRNYSGKVLVTRQDALDYVEAYAKGMTDLKDPKLSPLYAPDLSRLPPALFLVGTADIMLDDSVFMAMKWDLAGNKSSLKVIAEAAHGFTWFPLGDLSEEGINEITQFISAFA